MIEEKKTDVQHRFMAFQIEDDDDHIDEEVFDDIEKFAKTDEGIAIGPPFGDCCYVLGTVYLFS